MPSKPKSRKWSKRPEFYWTIELCLFLISSMLHNTEMMKKSLKSSVPELATLLPFNVKITNKKMFKTKKWRRRRWPSKRENNQTLFVQNSCQCSHGPTSKLSSISLIKQKHKNKTKKHLKHIHKILFHSYCKIQWSSADWIYRNLCVLIFFFIFKF